VFLHVVDASHEGMERRMAAVHKVLSEMGLRDRPEILVFNKLDRLPPGDGPRLAAEFGGVAVSAAQRIGFEALLERAEMELFETRTGEAIAQGEVLAESEGGTR
jgi:GTP-binding protein HflX